jgi:glycosyltransferase involved in cell wall biosynthesis
MLQQKPVVVTQSRALSGIVRQTASGVVYQDRSISSFIQAICSLSNEKLRKSLGTNGHRAVLTKFNWENDTARLLSAVNRVFN